MNQEDEKPICTYIPPIRVEYIIRKLAYKKNILKVLTYVPFSSSLPSEMCQEAKLDLSMRDWTYLT